MQTSGNVTVVKPPRYPDYYSDFWSSSVNYGCSCFKIDVELSLVWRSTLREILLSLYVMNFSNFWKETIKCLLIKPWTKDLFFIHDGNYFIWKTSNTLRFIWLKLCLNCSIRGYIVGLAVYRKAGSKFTHTKTFKNEFMINIPFWNSYEYETNLNSFDKQH